jgi:hypothetical protein
LLQQQEKEGRKGGVSMTYNRQLLDFHGCELRKMVCFILTRKYRERENTIILWQGFLVLLLANAREIKFWIRFW